MAGKRKVRTWTRYGYAFDEANDGCPVTLGLTTGEMGEQDARDLCGSRERMFVVTITEVLPPSRSRAKGKR